MQSKKVLQVSGIAAAIAAFYAYAGPQQASATMPGKGLPQTHASLPQAKPGECYAKVSIPAQYKTETVQLVAQEASVRFETIPAQYTLAEEKVLVKEASKDIVPVPAVYETVQQTVELAPARRDWLLGRSYMAKPASEALLNSIRETGVQLDALAGGTCLSEYYVPAQYETQPVKVLKSAGYEKIEVIPATFQWVEEKVLVKDASTQVIEVPAVYETVTEQVMLEPATTAWKAGSGLYQKIDNTTGEIMCLVEIPAKYKTVHKKVLKTPASTREVEIPAEYAMQRVRKLVTPASERKITVEPTYQVLDKKVKVADEKYFWQPDTEFRPAGGRSTGQTVCLHATEAKLATVEQYQIKIPASTRAIEVPAEYRMVKVRKLVKPAEKRQVEVPPVVETVQKKVKVSEQTSEWRKVLCETNITPGIVSNLQAALNAAGFNPGSMSGRMTSQTLRAVDDYQRAKGMERGGLTLNTLKSLGVKI